MPDGWFTIICSVCSAIVTGFTMAFKIGRRDGKLVTHDELDDKLKGYARADQLQVVQHSIDDLRKEQRDDFRTVISLIKDKK